MPSSTSRSGVYLRLGLVAAVAAAFDERAARVAIADQPFDATGTLQLDRPSRRRPPCSCRARARRSCRRRSAPSPAGPALRPAPCATGTRCGRPSCWPRWRSRSTRRSNGPAAGCRAKRLRSRSRPSAIVIAWPGSSDLDALGAKAEVQQRHALAGRGEQRPFDRIAQRPDAQRIAGHDHLAQRIEQHEAIRPVEPLADVAHHFDQRRPAIARQLAADLVHDDFGVVVARQVIVAVGQQLVAQLGVVGQLAVEAEAEPLVLLQMVPLERLGVAAVVRAAGGVANVADRRPAGVLRHQALGLAAMAEPKDFADAAHLLVGVEELLALRVEAASCRPKAGRGSGCPAASAASSRETSSGPCSGQSGLTLRPGR